MDKFSKYSKMMQKSYYTTNGIEGANFCRKLTHIGLKIRSRNYIFSVSDTNYKYTWYQLQKMCINQVFPPISFSQFLL